MIYEPGQDPVRSQARRRVLESLAPSRWRRGRLSFGNISRVMVPHIRAWRGHVTGLRNWLASRSPAGVSARHIAVTASCVAVIALVGLIIAPPSDARYAQQAVVLPAAPAQPAIVEDPLDWRGTTIETGQTLAMAFSAQGLSARDVHNVVNLDETTERLARIYPGDLLEFGFDDELQWQGVRYTPRDGPIMEVMRTPDGLTSRTIDRSIERRLEVASGSIDDSLFLAGQAAGLSDNTIMQIASIFGWDIDFVRDVWAGDSFQVVYETLYRDGEFLRQGDILAARFVNRGDVYEALRYEREDGEYDYYAPNGQPMRKAFLRSPLDVTRVTSRFTLKRYHPILKVYRPHRGVDYGASAGTPVRATGDGKVIFASKNSSYGNHVIIQHGSEYKTLYAHFSKFGRGIKSGVRVRQGQIIGYVGSTGLATAPHLHYEFRVNDVHRDPLRMKFPAAAPLPDTEMVRFREHTRALSAQLTLQASDLALNDEEPASEAPATSL